MKKSKYIKPQCEDIFLARGAPPCSSGSAATGCITGNTADISCSDGDGVSLFGCAAGSGAAGGCNTGISALAPVGCVTGQNAGAAGCSNGNEGFAI